MTALVRYHVDEHVATLTLDSQHNRNALSRQLVGELFAGLERAVARFGAVRLVLPVDDHVQIATVTPASRWRWYRSRKPIAAHA